MWSYNDWEMENEDRLERIVSSDKYAEEQTQRALSHANLKTKIAYKMNASPNFKQLRENLQQLSMFDVKPEQDVEQGM